MSAEKRTMPAKEFQPHMPGDWWLRQPRYFLFMIRELTSVFVALFVVLQLFYYLMLMAGPGTYAVAQAWAKSSGMIGLHVVILIFALYHSFTWLGVVGKIQVVRIGERVLSEKVVTAGAFAGWFAVSAALAAFLILGAS